nr:unnamed protein product [Spirometra erinaceieuropaei]
MTPTVCNLLAEEHRLNKAYVSRPTDENASAFYRYRRLAQQGLWEMQEAWTVRKPEEVQGHADCNEWKNFYASVKAIYGLTAKGTSLLLSSNGTTLFTEKTGVLKRPFTIYDAVIARLPQMETNADLHLPPFLHETIRAVQQIFSLKVHESDAIPIEIYKHGSLQLMDYLITLNQEMYSQGNVPHDFENLKVIYLCRRNWDRQIRSNHRAIPLLTIGGKIFARIPINCLNKHLQQDLLSESQRSFRRHREITDMIFAARQLQEKCHEVHIHLCSASRG